MVIKIFKSSFGGWMPLPTEWEKHRNILYPLCIGGNISFKKKEDLVDYLSSRGITAVEERITENIDAEQLMLF